MRRFIFNELKEHATKKQITLLVGARQTGKKNLLRQLQEEFETEGRRVFFLTLKKQKVDFIIENKMAYEVKYSEHLFKENKYAYFRGKYL